MIGILMSIRTTSGRVRRTRSSACRPSAASPASSRSSSASTSTRRPIRTSRDRRRCRPGSSSFGLSSRSRCSAAARGPRTRRPAPAGPAAYRQRRGALAHAGDAHGPRPACRPGSGRPWSTTPAAPRPRPGGRADVARRVPACRSTLVSASCTIRYAEGDPVGGGRRRRRRSTARFRPACASRRRFASRATPGAGAVGSARPGRGTRASVGRTRPARRCWSPDRRRSDSPACSGRLSSTCSATPACMLITDNECADQVVHLAGDPQPLLVRRTPQVRIPLLLDGLAPGAADHPQRGREPEQDQDEQRPRDPVRVEETRAADRPQRGRGHRDQGRGPGQPGARVEQPGQGVDGDQWRQVDGTARGASDQAPRQRRRRPGRSRARAGIGAGPGRAPASGSPRPAARSPRCGPGRRPARSGRPGPAVRTDHRCRASTAGHAGSRTQWPMKTLHQVSSPTTRPSGTSSRSCFASGRMAGVHRAIEAPFLVRAAERRACFDAHTSVRARTPTTSRYVAGKPLYGRCFAGFSEPELWS